MNMTEDTPTFVELETAAREVIEVLKTLPGVSGGKIAVIGGFAVWQHLSDFRVTKDVYFVTTVTGAPKSIKETLVRMPNTRFEDRAGVFYYNNPAGKAIQVDFVPHIQVPFLPVIAKTVSSLPRGQLPYASMVDLIVLKIHCCGLRAETLKKKNDAADARNLLVKAAQHGPLNLSENQRSLVNEGLADVVEETGVGKAWWKTRLGM